MLNRYFGNSKILNIESKLSLKSILQSRAIEAREKYKKKTLVKVNKTFVFKNKKFILLSIIITNLSLSSNTLVLATSSSKISSSRAVSGYGVNSTIAQNEKSGNNIVVGSISNDKQKNLTQRNSPINSSNPTTTSDPNNPNNTYNPTSDNSTPNLTNLYEEGKHSLVGKLRNGSFPGEPYIYRIPTKDKVVFLTIDDGFYPSSKAANLLKLYQIPTVNFIIGKLWEVTKDRKFYQSLLSINGEIGDHSMTHPDLLTLNNQRLYEEICRSKVSDSKYSKSEIHFFRPPGGAIDQRVVKESQRCGMQPILWDVTAAGNKYRTWGGPIRPGDIILMHWNPGADLTIANLIKVVKENHLSLGNINNYL